MAQAENTEMIKRESYIDIVVGPQSYHKINDTILFGRESSGVPEKIHKLVDNRIKIPLKPGKRSLNIASSVAIVLAESMRQNKIF